MSTSDIAKRYFAAIGAHDLDAATAVWLDGAIDRFVGGEELIAPDGIRRYFSEIYGAFPDFALEIIDLTTARNRTAVRWRATGTFAGPGFFQGLAPNGARLEIEGCDVLTVENDLITHNDAYLDTGAIARSLGVLPPTGSVAEQRFTRLANGRTRLTARLRGHSEAERVADGVWLVRGGFPLKEMNVYLIEDDDGVTVFDAGISDMTASVAAAAARLGGIKRVVLGHADADHRGTAPGLGAPVYCHAAEREAAESDDAFRSYFDLTKLNAVGRFLLSRLLPVWDGGAVAIAGEVKEGDDIAGFKVVDLPGHAPGLIGLYRESDRLALTSDCFYTLNPQTSIKGPPRVPHPAFDIDVDQARASIRKLAEIEPAAAWPGHADPVTGDVRTQLERAAAAPVP
jgi:glyoxylase-like metal-dependent hydrolase (beta-lactamase superfamily II)/predicted ester cyclase